MKLKQLEQVHEVSPSKKVHRSPLEKSSTNLKLGGLKSLQIIKIERIEVIEAIEVMEVIEVIEIIEGIKVIEVIEDSEDLLESLRVIMSHYKSLQVESL